MPHGIAGSLCVTHASILSATAAECAQKIIFHLSPMARPASPTAPPKKRRKGAPSPPKVSRTRRPENLQPQDWQVQLRWQFGREQRFELQNIGSEPVFSEFSVRNPDSGRSYRVAIRGNGLGDNFCACPDFATNDLGVCKHIAFTLARLEKRRGAKAALRAGFRPAYSELYLDYAGLRTVRLRIGSECPPQLRSRARALFDPNERHALRGSNDGQFDAFIAAAAHAGHELRCYDDALAHIAEQRDAQTRARVLDEAYPEGAASPVLQGLLKTPLYLYQAEGALFAARAGRCLIGDEMGLGKTVQALAALQLMRQHFGVERVLVVCPTSLKHQWQREFARFTHIGATVIGGLRAARRVRYAEPSNVKITHYETLARDLDMIQAWAPELVIVDEAQRVKNWNTIAARALKQVRAPYAVVLTGTPLENRLEELISIVQFVDRHRLGPTWRLLHEHQQCDAAGRVIGYRALDQVGATLAPIMLRRRKAEVLDQLPGRIDKNLFVPMTSEQMRHHEENRDIVARIVQRWRRSGFLSEGDQRRLTCALQNMRMSCDSSFLLDPLHDHGHKADELITLLQDLLAQPDAKVVVFSQWLRMHELIVRRLAGTGWGHVLFHGSVPGEQRGALVDRFIEDPLCRLFLSTDAGGVGLNLQHAAASVVNMDLPWNPAVLEQRIGRVFRLGQTRGVQVINFVSEGTIEEGMLQVLAFKKSIFAGVFDGGASDVFMQGSRLSKFMESVEQVSQATQEVRTLAPEAQAEAAAGAAIETPSATPGEAAGDAAPARPEAGPTEPPDPWAGLLESGLRLFESVAQQRSNGGPAGWIETDAQTGQHTLKLPLPSPQTVQRALSLFQSLLQNRR
jgi:superfamily II DNA or RNA helicase